MTTERQNRQELLVWGYIRDMEKMYKLMNIPTVINDIIYSYQTFYDEWCKKYSHQGIIIDESTNKVTFNAQSNMTAYGSNVIKSGIFTWRIKTIKLTGGNGWSVHPYIGIIENDEEKLKRFVNNGSWERCGYQFCAGNGNICGKNVSDSRNIYKYSVKSDDVLEVVLDLNEGKLQFIVNEQDIRTVLDDVDKDCEYRFVLTCAYHEGSEFSLL